MSLDERSKAGSMVKKLAVLRKYCLKAQKLKQETRESKTVKLSTKSPGPKPDRKGRLLYRSILPESGKRSLNQQVANYTPQFGNYPEAALYGPVLRKLHASSYIYIYIYICVCVCVTNIFSTYIHI